MSPLLQINDLRTVFHAGRGIVRAVDGVSLTVNRGKTLGIVGESGCGKSVTALSILRLIPEPPGEIVGGEILFDTVPLLKLPEKEMRKIRGRKIAMIFQEPMTSLNPVFTVGEQIAEMLRLHLKMGRRQAMARAADLLGQVGISSPELRVRDYPHQLSGGMRQRVMIAMAISCGPDLLLADEPTTALDVTIQAQILALLKDLKDRLKMALILVSHDLGVIAQVADEVAVMYAGRVVEYAPTQELFARPLHPYTRGLLASLPVFRADEVKRRRLAAIPGSVPDPADLPRGCKFTPRCGVVVDRCPVEEPTLITKFGDHEIRCWLER